MAIFAGTLAGRPRLRLEEGRARLGRLGASGRSRRRRRNGSRDRGHPGHHHAARGGPDRLLAGARVSKGLGWARKYSLFQYPFVTACCGMEFMSVAAARYDIARFGAEFPRFSPRQADLLMVVGTITGKQAPVLRRIYEQMGEPKWVIAFGVCAARAASTTTTRRCRASIRSSRSTSTSPAARRGRSRCSTASCSCRRRSRTSGTSSSTASRAPRRLPWPTREGSRARPRMAKAVIERARRARSPTP